MTTLNVVLTHLAAPVVDAGVRYLEELAPHARFVICHVGDAEDFEGVEHKQKLFVDDPSFRAPPITFQSLNMTLSGVYEQFVRDDATIRGVYVFEYDHLVLRSDFEEQLSAVATRSGADFVGKTCVERTATNWPHYVRFRRDERLLAHLRKLSTREDPARMYGCVGNGFWLTREALHAYAEVESHPPCYGELYVPTLLHHLGFKVGDIDTHSDVYRHVRWAPPFTLHEVLRLKREGATFVHPFKDLGALGAVTSAPGAADVSADGSGALLAIR